MDRGTRWSCSAALRTWIPYVDVAAEVEASADTLAHVTDRARVAGAVIVPAMAFDGDLGDLLATAAVGDWAAADEALGSGARTDRTVGLRDRPMPGLIAGG